MTEIPDFGYDNKDMWWGLTFKVVSPNEESKRSNPTARDVIKRSQSDDLIRCCQ